MPARLAPACAVVVTAFLALLPASGKRIHLVLTGKVTTARTTVSDCAGVSFTEAHDLCAVGF